MELGGAVLHPLPTARQCSRHAHRGQGVENCAGGERTLYRVFERKLLRREPTENCEGSVTNDDTTGQTGVSQPWLIRRRHHDADRSIRTIRARSSSRPEGHRPSSTGRIYDSNPVPVIIEARPSNTGGDHIRVSRRRNPTLHGGAPVGLRCAIPTCPEARARASGRVEAAMNRWTPNTRPAHARRDDR